MMKEKNYGFLFTLPAIVLFIVVLGIPVIMTVINSFTPLWAGDYSSFTLANYARLTKDSAFRTTFSNTLIFVSFTVGFHLILGMIVALALNTDIRFIRFFRVVAILPWTIPDSVSGLIWRFLFDPMHGAINQMLMLFNLIQEPIEWLSVPGLSLPSVIFADVWRGYPFVMLILLAGMQSIPEDLYEAAKVDGASAVRKFVHITIPQLQTIIVIALALDTVWQFRRFGLIYTMTGGGPGRQTEILATLVQKQYFEFFNFEYAAAMALFTALVMLVITLPYVRIMVRGN
ncbi:MAG: sugar ABC transporter permease [Desulfobacteraceae bacterium]|nr:MAG: sugar ABC transporter permease [Desulfobacteraceae bacterium]